jgi:hypothetical protein
MPETGKNRQQMAIGATGIACRVLGMTPMSISATDQPGKYGHTYL